MLSLYKRIKNRQGFTVIELIVAIAIASILIIISINLLGVTNKTHSLSLKEYDLQSAIRRAAEETNQAARYSKAVFAVPQTFVASTDKMDPGWDYIMVSHDGKRIISMEYDDNEDKEEFVERVLVPEHENIRYEIFFEKESKAEADNVIRFVISAYIVDKNGNKTAEKAVYGTTLESVNAVQVADKGTGIPGEGVQGASPSIALAHRSDGRTSGKGRNDFAYITLVVDTSGSMKEKPNGDSTRNVKESRIYLVKEALTGYNTGKTGIIQKFAKEENIHISLVPFSLTANYPTTTANEKPDWVHPVYDVFNEDEKNELIGEIDKLIADHGTNTGDGLRRAYYLHDSFRGRMGINEKYPIHHYMILLVDGKSTYDVREGSWDSKRGSYTYKDGWGYNTTATNRWRFKPTGSNIITNENWWTFINHSNSVYYLEDGNIKLTTPINYIYASGQSGNKAPQLNYSIVGTGTETTNNLNNIGTRYVAAVGNNLIKNFKDQDEKEIKSYIIGYAKNLEANINDIGEAIGTDPNKIYAYTKDFDINEVLQDIANDIMADFWIVAGPQIRK